MNMNNPISYTLETVNPKAGKSWVTFTVVNQDDCPLHQLNVQLNSLDTYHLTVTGTGSFIAELHPGDKVTIPFQIEATGSARVYLSIDGTREAKLFTWESPAVVLNVGKQPAVLESLFVMKKPYLLIGEKIKCEATVRGLFDEDTHLRLEFWTETPSTIFKQLDEVAITQVRAGEIQYYAAETIPDEQGIYHIYAYLYDGLTRIGKETETVFAQPVI